MKTFLLLLCFFFRNGDSKGGVPILVTAKDLEDEWSTFFQRLKVEAPLVVKPRSESEDWTSFKIFDSNGTAIGPIRQLLDYDKQNIYIVPKNRQFYWPYVRLGHRAYLKDTDTEREIVIESLSERPRIFYIHNLVSHEEADFLVSNAPKIEGQNGLMRSTTGTQPREDRDLNDPNMVDSTRTSDNAWDMESDVAVSVFQRMFSILRMRPQRSQQDGLQLVRYNLNQAYRQHHDYYEIGMDEHNYDPKTGGSNRYATIFMYLSDVKEGGQTNFPHVDVIPDNLLEQLDPVVAEALSSHKQSDDIISHLTKLYIPHSWEKIMVEECYKTFSVKPKKTASIMFYDLTPEMVPDELTLHGGCPVLNGTKWGANAWIWNGPIPGTNEETSIILELFNGFEHTGTLFWKDTDLGTIKTGEVVNLNTYNGHQFVFKIDDIPVWSHIINLNDGVDQSFQMSVSTEHQEL